MKWLEQMLNNNSHADWIAAGLVTIGVLFLLMIFKRVFVHYIKVYARKTQIKLDDVLASALVATRPLLLSPIALYAGGLWLTLPARLGSIIELAAIIVLLIQVALWGNRFILDWVAQSVREKQQQDAASETTLSFIGFVARLALWAVILLLTLDNLGFDITALLAGVGIGGIAVALAAQNILGDLFASLSIVLDRPFVIGDFIVVGEQMGTVEHIGIKTTRLRSLGGEQIIFSNTDLLNSRIRNYKRMNERRVLFTFGVVYQTAQEKLRKIPGMLRAVIEAQGKTRFDRAHFKDYGDSSLNFEVVYYVLDRDYNLYMDIQQSINLAMFEGFQAAGIEFAYPTRTLYLTPATGDAHA